MYDVTIIGCGVIGASLAYHLSRFNLSILVLEQENDVAMGTTKANSAIVHAGYDPEHGTLMARLNLRGSVMMEELCRTISVPYRRIGSLVLAFSLEEMAKLEHLYRNGIQNGVAGLRLLSGEEVREKEPGVPPSVCGALYAPTAAIIDPWELCIAEAETAVRNGVDLKLRSRVTGIEDLGGACRIQTTSGVYESKYLVNCAGGWGHLISRMVGPQEWQAIPAKGEYYLLDKSSGSLVSHIIFQCPTSEGKGVLVAPTVHGNLIVGPNTEPAENAYDRKTTAAGLEAVVAIGKKSVPALDLRQSIRNFAGVRAITSEQDFIIRPSQLTPRLLHVAGIKSPGLSAAPAIAEYATALLRDMGLQMQAKDHWDGTRQQIRFRDLSPAEKAELIARDSSYGRVVCRCESITEGEILAAIHSPIPPCSIDGVKRRTGSGMGRCQGGFCSPRIMGILSRELGIPPMNILQDGDGTRILMSRMRGEEEEHV